MTIYSGPLGSARLEQQVDTLHELARHAEETARASGWDVPTIDNLPGKLMCACTEIEEAASTVLDAGGEREPSDAVFKLPEELADAALRLLACMNAIWPGQWTDRVGRRLDCMPTQAPNHAFAPIEVLLWPTFRCVCRAQQAWRKAEDDNARMWLEFALVELWKLGAKLGYDLTAECRRKLEVNRTRGRLHGNRRSLG